MCQPRRDRRSSRTTMVRVRARVPEDDGSVRRQLEVYSSGVVLAYDESHLDDRYGGLTDQRLDLVDFAPYEVPGEEFERVWSPATAYNRGASLDDEP